MDYSNNIEKKLNKKRLIRIFTPSWISSLIAVLAGLIVTLGVIIAFNFNSSQIQQQLISYENTNTKQPALTLPGQAPPPEETSSLQNTWPLIAFWAVVGLIVYFVAESIYNVINNAEEFTKELNYVHAKRDLIIRTAIENIVLRIVIAILWLFFIDLSLKKILPNSINTAQQAATNPHLIQSILYGAASFIMIVVSAHLNIVFLRLVMRRTRIFSGSEYLDV